MSTEPTITLTLTLSESRRYAAQIQDVCPELAEALLRDQSDEKFMDRVRIALESQGMIYAVKLHRELFGSSLKQAKDAVDAIGDAALLRNQNEEVLRERVRHMFESQGLVSAVKLHRELFGSSLKQAKDAVDAISEKMQAAISEKMQTIEKQVGQALEDEGYVQAIRVHRELTGASLTGVGLEKSRQAVDAIREKQVIETKKVRVPGQFFLGDAVTWVSQAGGYQKRKQGKIVSVVAKGKTPRVSLIKGTGLSRNRESYVVQVGNKFYWPHVSALSLDE